MRGPEHVAAPGGAKVYRRGSAGADSKPRGRSMTRASSSGAPRQCLSAFCTCAARGGRWRRASSVRRFALAAAIW